MSKSRFPKSDSKGFATLNAIAVADKFNKWMYETIKPFCSGQILEIGSGTGNISQFFLKDGLPVTLSDISSQYCQILTEKFAAPYHPEVVQLDIAHPDFANQYASYLGKFDTVVALNVIEHISDDTWALENCRKLLKSGGTFIILVPAFQALYNRFDVELQHYRRYNKQTLKNFLKKGDFSITHIQYFNMMGISGWYLYGTVLKRRLISGNLMSSYNKLVPFFKILDKVSFNSLGLSVIAVGKKI
jgi:2-polyprenyl-3-methyl-5-hydroxy-6-metoxy-1,4-benzoquinol methylase